MIRKILTATVAATLGATTVSYAASGPTVFPHGIASSAPVVTPDGVTQGTIGDTVTKAQGSVQKSDIGLKNSVAPTDANAMMSAPVSGDTSASPATALGATNSRTLSNHLGDFLNVRDYGAKLDGTTDDTAAFSYAKAHATDGQNIVVPPGTTSTVNLTSIPQGEAGKTNIWWLFGRTLPNGSPLFNFGSDTVFSSINGGLWLHRDDNIPGQGPALRTDVVFNHDGDAGAATQDNCNASAVSFSTTGLWCHQTIMHTSATDGAQIAESSSAFREGIGGQVWGRYTEATDKTGLSSDKSGSVAGHEEDVYANDKDPYNWRIIQENMIARFIDNGYAARVGTGNLWGRNDSVSYYGSVIRIEAPWDTVGIDLSKGGPLSILGTITQAADAGATVLTLDTTHNGVEVGQSVSGTGVASGTTVTGITDTTVTLSTGLTSAVKSGDTLRFSSDAPAIRLGSDQYISYLGDNSLRMYGDAVNHNLSTQIDGNVRFVYGTHGDTSVYGDGSSNVLTVHGNYVTGLDFTDSGFLGAAILLNANQNISWELSQTVKTSFHNGALTDQVAPGVARTLDTQGNETIPGSVTSAQSIVKINNATGSAYTPTGTALVGLDTTGLTATDALRMAEGQHVSWEATTAVQTHFADGNLQDTLAGTPIRSLDMSGNETLSGALTPSGGIRLPTFSRAAIKGMSNLPIGTTLYDVDDDAPAIYTSAGWKLAALNAMP